MKKFTKVMALLLSLSMVLCFAACGGTTEETTAAGGEETTAADVAYDLTKEGDYTADNTEYVIGATGPLTGDAASYGISVQQGAQLAIDEINAAGGLNGVNFKLDIKDDKATAADASTGYDALFEAGMQASLGSVTSGSAESFATRAAEDGIFALTPSASADNVINASNNCFRVCFGDPDNGIMSAEKLAAEYENIGAIYDSSDAYSSGIYEAFKAQMATLGKEYIEQSFDAENNRDFSTQIEALKDCDVIFLPIYYTEAGLIAKACVAKGCDAFLFGCDGLDGVAAQIDDTVTNKISYLTPFDVNSEDAKVAKFVTDYEAKYGSKPDQFAADGYDAVYAIYEAMKVAGVDNVNVDPVELSKALVSVFTSDTFSYDGVTGGMQWEASGACEKEPIIVEIN
ncbi:MAG: ABC transporter substrate-binding protein [Clostridia bacterium]|nr:ABC transporter substrate-binding protein [Clostridia bacterium]